MAGNLAELNLAHPGPDFSRPVRGSLGFKVKAKFTRLLRFQGAGILKR